MGHTYRPYFITKLDPDEENSSRRFYKTVAPLVKNIKGQYEVVVAVIYNEEGIPIELQLAGNQGKIVSVADWEPLEAI